MKRSSHGPRVRVLLVANWDWVVTHFRLPLACRLRDEGYEVVLCSPPGPYVADMRHEGFAWYAWGLERRSMNIWQELRSARELAGLIERQQPDLVHAFTIKPVVYASLVVGWRSLVRRAERPRVLIANLTGLGYLFSNARLAWLLRLLLWPVLLVCLRQSRVHTVLMNDGDRRRLADMGMLVSKRSHMIRGTGVDTVRFAPAEREVNCGRPLQVLFAGRLLTSKGVMDFLEAADRLSDEGIGARFLVAGTPDVGNPDAVRIETLQQWEDAGAVRWLGHVTDVSGLLAEVDVLAVPTYYPEGIPRILLEGAAAGCGLVATDTDGCRELVRHGGNGLLVPVRDPATLAGAIRQLLVDSVRRIEMGAEARRDAVRWFDICAINEEWVGLYRRCLKMG